MTIDFDKIKSLLEQEELNKRQVPQEFVDYILNLIERLISNNDVSPHINDSKTIKIIFKPEYVSVTVLGEALVNFGDNYYQYYGELFKQKGILYTKTELQKDYGDDSIRFKLSKLPENVRSVVDIKGNAI